MLGKKKSRPDVLPVLYKFQSPQRVSTDLLLSASDPKSNADCKCQKNTSQNISR